MKQIAFDHGQEIWRQAWETNDIRVPFLTYAWHKLWYDVFSPNWEPFLLVSDDVVAPFMRQGNIIRFSGGEDIADYLDIIGPHEKKQFAWQNIIEYCKAQRIERMILHNVPEDSPTVTLFENIVHREDTTPKIILPSSWNLYVESLPYKHRHELERKIRKFEKEHPEAHVRLSDNPSADIQALLALMMMSGVKHEFLTSSMIKFFIRISDVFASEISLLLLNIENKLAAATFSFVNRSSYYLYNSGFDKSCCKNAGFYLKSMTIKHAIEQNIQEYNFLQGNERYKYELGGTDFAVYTIDYEFLLTVGEKRI